MKPTPSRYRRIACLVLLLLGWCPALCAQANQPYRFLVISDPQFRIARQSAGAGDQAVVDGYRWTSTLWPALPQLSQRLGARFLFVCGDIFEYKDGDGSTIDALWNHWDRYTHDFARLSGGIRLEWTTGGHEFWGGGQDYDHAAIRHFLKRYPDKVRYAVRDGDNLFILFDNIHDPTYLDPNGIEWLKTTLESSRGWAKHIFFFGHVPPRNTAAWWPDGTGAKVDTYRSQMAELLTKHRTTAAFFGHEHFPSYLGDAGGFPMFVVAFRAPLLVEIHNSTVSYRWLTAPQADDPLAQTANAIDDRPVEKLHVAAIPPGRKPADPPPQIDPTHPLRLDDGTEVPFQEITPDAQGIPLSQIANLQTGGQVLAIAQVPRENYWAQHFRIRSGAAGTVYFNTQQLGRLTANPHRWNTWHVRPARNHPNRVAVLLDITDPSARFTIVPHRGT